MRCAQALALRTALQAEADIAAAAAAAAATLHTEVRLLLG